MYSAPGGYAGSMWRGKGLGTNPTWSGAITGVDVFLSGIIAWSSRSIITSPSDGTIKLSNNTQTDFTRLQFGGTTSSFPALGHSGSSLMCVVADGTGFATIYANDFRAASPAGTSSAGQVSYGGSTATTVGAAGAAAALPTNPVGYIIINVAGAQMKLPYYNT